MRVSLPVTTALLLSAVAVTAVAQQSWAPADTPVLSRRDRTFIRFAFQPGYVLQTSDFVKGSNAAGEPIEFYQALRLELGWHATGHKLWHDLYHNPAYGLGFYLANFSNDAELGDPAALYGFLLWPFYRFQNYDISAEIGFGYAFPWKHFDRETNPFNSALGSKGSVYIDAAFTATWRLSPRWDLAAGAGFTHFSNGGTAKPNLGLNTIQPVVNFRYNLTEVRPHWVNRGIPSFGPGWELYFYLAGGGKQAEVDPNIDELWARYGEVEYGVGTFAAALQYWFWHMSKVGGGVDVSRDKSMAAQVDISNGIADDPPPAVSTGDEFTVSVFGGYEHAVSDRLSALVHVGRYVKRLEFPNQTPDLWQRLGLKYHFLKDTFAGLNVRFYNFGKADYLEWNIGHRFTWF